LKHDSKPFFGEDRSEWLVNGIFHHLTPLFCTVSANDGLASCLATKISNEIKDLAPTLQVSEPQKPF
jgi:hypothetical protein